MLDRADDMVMSGGVNSDSAELENVIAAHLDVVEVAAATQPCAAACVKVEASVTEKQVVDLCAVHLGNDERPGKLMVRCSERSGARNFVSRFGLVGSAGSRATDDVRGTLARMSQEARSFHRTRWVLCDRCAARAGGVAKD
jgi:acyl-CoA synthetase (AMP-forming)/AMP-acid ligase II